MPAEIFNSKSLTHRLKDQQVTHAIVDGSRHLTVQFSDGTALIIEAGPDGLVTRVEDAGTAMPQGNSHRPTKRQFEYLAFIAKYIQRFGRAPAEADMERHFLVSAPSVNQMMQTLERRGFITRLPGVPRSIRIRIDMNAPNRPGHPL
jgi:repressor LexA